MKALTIWQPWATLIITGQKLFETRSWQTNYRGPLVIHAAAARNPEAMALCHREPFLSAINHAGIERTSDLPFGAVLGIVNLLECYPTEDVHLTDRERAFGDFTPGRFAWELKVAVHLDEPIKATGKQGLWEWARWKH